MGCRPSVAHLPCRVPLCGRALTTGLHAFASALTLASAPALSRQRPRHKPCARAAGRRRPRHSGASPATQAGRPRRKPSAPATPPPPAPLVEVIVLTRAQQFVRQRREIVQRGLLGPVRAVPPTRAAIGLDLGQLA